jgi:transcription elongation factor Elf1
MPALSFTCPNTNQRASAGIQADAESLRKSWSKKVTVNCSLCGRVHEFAVRELYTESILRDAIEATDTFGRA